MFRIDVTTGELTTPRLRYSTDHDYAGKMLAELPWLVDRVKEAWKAQFVQPEGGYTEYDPPAVNADNMDRLKLTKLAAAAGTLLVNSRDPAMGIAIQQGQKVLQLDFNTDRVYAVGTQEQLDRLTREIAKAQLQVESLKDRLSDPDHEVPFKHRLGRCYELSGRLASNNDGVTLVHGSIQGFGNPRIDHAWVELEDGDVWEPASGKVWAKAAFDAVFNPIAVDRYTNEQVLVNSLRNRHWGPWPLDNRQTKPRSLKRQRKVAD